MMIHKEIEKELNSGLSRKQVLKKLKGKDDVEELVYHINTLCSREARQRFLFLNLLIIGLLVVLTARKVFVVIGYGYFDMTAMAAMVVPVVNVYILRQLMRFHKNGYRFLFILSILSLVHQENRFPLELMITITLIILSGFLYAKLFGKKTLVGEDDA